MMAKERMERPPSRNIKILKSIQRRQKLYGLSNPNYSKNQSMFLILMRNICIAYTIRNNTIEKKPTKINFQRQKTMIKRQKTAVNSLKLHFYKLLVDLFFNFYMNKIHSAYRKCFILIVFLFRQCHQINNEENKEQPEEKPLQSNFLHNN